MLESDAAKQSRLEARLSMPLTINAGPRQSDRAPSSADRVAALRAHIESRMAVVEVEAFPFPHMVIEDIFPADVYRQILELNPFRENRGSEWLKPEQSLNVSARTPYASRKQLDLAKEVAFEASLESRALWSDVRRCFTADGWFESLVLAKYPAYFEIRFGELVDHPDFFSLLKRQLFLQRHEPGFVIGPHTDLPTRIFTCIFSFAETEGFEEYGTQLLSHKDPMIRCWGNDHYGAEDFVVRKVAPYRPNNLLLFFKTRQSFHAVRSIDARVPNQRYGMQFQLHEPAGGLFKDLSAPQLMRFQRDPQPS